MHKTSFNSPQNRRRVMIFRAQRSMPEQIAGLAAQTVPTAFEVCCRRCYFAFALLFLPNRKQDDISFCFAFRNKTPPHRHYCVNPKKEP